MPDHTKTLDLIAKHRVSAIIRAHDESLAEQAMAAAVRGGFRIVEFTLTTPGAFSLISKFARQASPALLVGAGTVLTMEDVQRAADAGASFVVSPVCDPAVIARAKEFNLVTIPGCFTPNEMLAAHRAGADIIKLFPAPANVAEWILSIKGPLPMLKIFPTAGVTADNLHEVLRAGAFGAGFVRALFDPNDMKEKNFDSITRRAARIIQANTSFVP